MTGKYCEKKTQMVIRRKQSKNINSTIDTHDKEHEMNKTARSKKQRLISNQTPLKTGFLTM